MISEQPSSLEIRRYRVTDKKQVLDLHVLAVKAAGLYIPGPWDRDLDDIEGNYLTTGEFLVGLINEQIIAMGGLRRISSDIVELKRMRVHPGFQRRGFGQMILDRLEKQAKNLGFKTIRLETTDKFTAARKFYEKNRYRETRRKDSGTDLDFIIIEYQKRLP